MSFLRHILPGEHRSDSETFDSGLFAVVDTETTGLFQEANIGLLKLRSSRWTRAEGS